MPSRRHVLAALGGVALSGCTGTGLSTPGREAPDPPAPFLSEPTDWAQPGHDAANTNAAPARAAPDDVGATAHWAAGLEATQFDRVAGPVVADGVAYLAVGGVDRGDEFERLVAFDAWTGEERWRHEIQDSPYPTPYPPTVAGETVYWLASADEVLALHAADGTVQWTNEGNNHRPPVVAHGLVLTYGGTPRDPALEALDPRTGRPYWTRDRNSGSWFALGADDVAFYATLYPETEGESPALHALDPQTGETRWTTSRIAPRAATFDGDSVFASGGRPDAQELLAFDVTDREPRWTETRDLQWEVDDDEVVNGDWNVAAVTDDHLLVHLHFHGYLDDRIEMRDPATGEVRWTLAPDADDAVVSFGAPVVAGDRVYVTSVTDPHDGGTGALRVHDIASGERLAQHALAAPTYSKPVVAAGRAYVVTWPSLRNVRLTAR